MHCGIVNCAQPSFGNAIPEIITIFGEKKRAKKNLSCLAADEAVIGRRLSSACYVEDALPAIIYLALKYHHDAARGLIANTNLGGDNAGRGAVLGAFLGAAIGLQVFPKPWVDGLRHPPINLDLLTKKGKE